jgi:hypothetical protein
MITAFRGIVKFYCMFPRKTPIVIWRRVVSAASILISRSQLTHNNRGRYRGGSAGDLSRQSLLIRHIAI